MSYHFPASLERDIEEYAQDENISPTDAAIRLIQDALAASKHKVSEEASDIDDQILQLKALNRTFGLLEDVPDEQIDRMSATIERMKAEEFPSRG